MQIKTYLQILSVTRQIFCGFIQGTCLCPVIRLYYTSVPLINSIYVPYPLLYIFFCFCINYANEVYLHRDSIFSVEKCNYNKAYANLKIAKKNMAVMTDTFFENLLLYALMSNLCKLCIYLHNN